MDEQFVNGYEPNPVPEPVPTPGPYVEPQPYAGEVPPAAPYVAPQPQPVQPQPQPAMQPQPAVQPAAAPETDEETFETGKGKKKRSKEKPAKEKPSVEDRRLEPIKPWGFVGIWLLLAIPGLNILLTIIWACGGCRKVNKRNMARGILIMFLIGLLLLAVAFVGGMIAFGGFEKFIEFLTTFAEDGASMITDLFADYFG